jgi:hypothetical protein
MYMYSRKARVKEYNVLLTDLGSTKSGGELNRTVAYLAKLRLKEIIKLHKEAMHGINNG